jgi:hypothetical protein
LEPSQSGGQLELFALSDTPTHLTVGEAFDLLWEGHLKHKPAGASYLANRKALCRSFGSTYVHSLQDIDLIEHKTNRLKGLNGFRTVGLGSVFHDHGLLRLLYSKLAEWKRRRAKINGIDLSFIVLPTEYPTVGVKKVKPPKRKVIATPGQFLALCQNATPRLKRTLEGLIDLDIRQNDLRSLRTSHYNPYTDQVEWIQSKTGKENCIPVSNRVRKHFIEAREAGREFVYDTTNSRKEFEEAKRTAKLFHITLRDIRKTAYNETLRHTGSHHLAGMVAGHASTRTGIDYYEIEFREGLRPVVAHIEKTYRSN